MALKWWKYDDKMQATRRRLRAGYRGALERNTINAEANARGYYEKKLADAKADMAVQVAELTRRTERAEATAREVVRVQLEYGPRRFSTRFMLYARCDETWIRNANDLTQHMDLILSKLAAMLVHEFRQIDFNRVKPNRFEPDGPSGPKYPVWLIEQGGGDRT